MRCTEEQFNELKPRLDKYALNNDKDCWFNLERYPYLTNNYNNKKYSIGSSANEGYYKNEAYETFNADLFLQCCGVELEETFTLTKSEIIENKDKTLKEMFKGVFEVEKFTGWAKTKLEGNEKWLVYFENNIMKYGFNANSDYFIQIHGLETFDIEFDYKATEEEVKTALENEAIKRGFKEGVNYINIDKQKQLAEYNAKHFHTYKDEIGITLDCGGGQGLIFSNGKWATIIKQKEMTVAEIEKKYNIKIIK